MQFEKHFKESQQEIAKEYLRQAETELKRAISLSKQGKFDASEIHGMHGLRLLGELRTMNKGFISEMENVRYHWM